MRPGGHEGPRDLVCYGAGEQDTARRMEGAQGEKEDMARAEGRRFYGLVPSHSPVITAREPRALAQQASVSPPSVPLHPPDPASVSISMFCPARSDFHARESSAVVCRVQPSMQHP